MGPVRVWAAVLAITLTILLTLLLKAAHPPAGATTLLVALGALKIGQDAMNVIMGVLIVAAVGEAVRPIRMKTATPRAV